MEQGLSDEESGNRRSGDSVNCGEVREACARTGTRFVEEVAMTLQAAHAQWSARHDPAALARALSKLLDLLAKESTFRFHRRVAEI
jgi:hypothetical protein